MTRGIEAEIIERHATEAALLWPLRDKAVRDAAYDLASLGHLDERLEANLDGLRLAGDAGWAAACTLLEDSHAGAVFTAMAIAVDRRDMRGVAKVLDVAAADPVLSRAVVSALGWCRYDQLERILPGLLATRSPPALHFIGIGASAAHRKKPGPALANATISPDLRLRARALRAIGELGLAELLPEVRQDSSSPDDGCRFAAAWTGMLLCEPDASRVLCDIASNGSPHAERACDTAMRRAAPADAVRWLEHVSRAPSSRRAAVAGAAALGDPASIPWLLELLEDAESARVAANAIGTITGVDFRAAGLVVDAPKGAARGPTDDPADENVAPDSDEALPWPDPTALRAFWGREAGRFKRGERLLLGKAMSGEWLSEVLRGGNQPQRAAAAMELVLRSPGTPLFEVRAPAFRQQ